MPNTKKSSRTLRSFCFSLLCLSFSLSFFLWNTFPAPVTVFSSQPSPAATLSSCSWSSSLSSSISGGTKHYSVDSSKYTKNKNKKKCDHSIQEQKYKEKDNTTLSSLERFVSVSGGSTSNTKVNENVNVNARDGLLLFVNKRNPLVTQMKRKSEKSSITTSPSVPSNFRSSSLLFRLLDQSGKNNGKSKFNPLVAFSGYSNGDSDGFIETFFDTWTKKIIAINILTFLAGKYNPALVHMGAKVDYKIYYGEWHRFFTPIFLHGNLQHLAINCYSMNSIGGTMESIMSPPVFLATYFISGITGNMLSYYIGSAPRAVGSSTGIAGLLGALGIYAFRHRGILRTDYMMRGVMQTIVLNIWSGLSSSRIDNMGHLGGLLGGAAACYFIGPRYRRRRPPYTGLENKPLFPDTFQQIFKFGRKKNNFALGNSNNKYRRENRKNKGGLNAIQRHANDMAGLGRSGKKSSFFFVGRFTNNVKLPLSFFQAGKGEGEKAKNRRLNNPDSSNSIEETLQEMKRANRQFRRWDSLRKQVQDWTGTSSKTNSNKNNNTNDKNSKNNNRKG